MIIVITYSKFVIIDVFCLTFFSAFAFDMYVPSYLLCYCIFSVFFLINCLPYLVNNDEYSHV